MKYKVGDIVIINNNYLYHTVSSNDQYNNIAIIKRIANDEKDTYLVIVSRNNSAMFTTGAKIKEEGILQLLPINTRIKYNYFSMPDNLSNECYINSDRKLIDTITDRELDYMNLHDFRITCSYTGNDISKMDMPYNNSNENNILLNKVYKALGR